MSGEDAPGRGNSKGKGLGQSTPGKMEGHWGGRGAGRAGREGEEERLECSRSHTQLGLEDTAGTSAITLSEMRANGELLSREAFPSTV